MHLAGQAAGHSPKRRILERYTLDDTVRLVMADAGMARVLLAD
jgi:hypothetical protein